MDKQDVPETKENAKAIEELDALMQNRPKR